MDSLKKLRKKVGKCNKQFGTNLVRTASKLKGYYD
jgi:hypothetical protein